jgi:hypothetical protein
MRSGEAVFVLVRQFNLNQPPSELWCIFQNGDYVPLSRRCVGNV